MFLVCMDTRELPARSQETPELDPKALENESRTIVEPLFGTREWSAKLPWSQPASRTPRLAVTRADQNCEKKAQSVGPEFGAGW